MYVTKQADSAMLASREEVAVLKLTPEVIGAASQAVEDRFEMLPYSARDFVEGLFAMLIDDFADVVG
jgi:hypothetical protein